MPREPGPLLQHPRPRQAERPPPCSHRSVVCVHTQLELECTLPSCALQPVTRGRRLLSSLLRSTQVQCWSRVRACAVAAKYGVAMVVVEGGGLCVVMAAVRCGTGAAHAVADEPGVCWGCVFSQEGSSACGSRPGRWHQCRGGPRARHCPAGSAAPRHQPLLDPVTVGSLLHLRPEPRLARMRSSAFAMRAQGRSRRAQTLRVRAQRRTALPMLCDGFRDCVAQQWALCPGPWS